jgi:membrane-associated PAP2 superfamily phosphatase
MHWKTHAAIPGAAFLLAMLAISGFDLDRQIASALFYDGHWMGAHTAWANAWIHTGGRSLVLVIALAALVVLGAGSFTQRLRAWRRQALFVVLAIGLSTALVAVLKHTTNVDCPWALEGFGGTHPYVPLFRHRPDFLPTAACFPGAHSSSGFALICFYFLLPGGWRRIGLAAGLGTGLLFAFGQEARGAHFLSHDLASAALVWGVQLALSRLMLQHGSERAIDPALQPRLTV